MNATTIAVCGALFALLAMGRIAGAARRAGRSREDDTPRAFARLRTRARRGRPERVDWAAALEQIAAELRTGSSLSRAVAGCLPGTGVRSGIESGDSLVASLGRLDPSTTREDADGASDRRLALGTLIAVARVGGGGGAAIERTADTIRERREAIAERHAQAAQARLSAVVLSVLPPVFALWSVTTDARVRSFLLGSALGGACLGCGALLNLCGWWWMRRLTGASGR